MSIWDGITPESQANIGKNRRTTNLRRASQYAPGGKIPTYRLHDTAKELVAPSKDKRAAMRKFNWRPGVMQIRVFRGTYRWWVQYPIGTSGVGLKHFATWDIAMRFAQIKAEYRV